VVSAGGRIGTARDLQSQIQARKQSLATMSTQTQFNVLACFIERQAARELAASAQVRELDHDGR
jgi:hypothetical protein